MCLYWFVIMRISCAHSTRSRLKLIAC